MMYPAREMRATCNWFAASVTAVFEWSEMWSEELIPMISRWHWYKAGWSDCPTAEDNT